MASFLFITVGVRLPSIANPMGNVPAASVEVAFALAASITVTELPPLFAT
jgi:hypothetical protein